VIWAVINRGGEQGAQHSQALHAVFAHIPGLKVVMPATPYDAKGLMIAAIRDDNPVIFMDDRWLYRLEEAVPEEPYEIPIGKGILRRSGKDLTIAALSYMAFEAGKAAAALAEDGVEVDLIDFRTAKPLDRDLLIASVRKTGRLIVADGGWRTGGFAAEVMATAAENCYQNFKSAPLRVTLPDTPAPASVTLEQAYYPVAADIIQAAKKSLA
jgi:pyruvate/2-oxoglutarate/acetoin dehydrogenase E1 component